MIQASNLRLSLVCNPKLANEMYHITDDVTHCSQCMHTLQLIISLLLAVQSLCMYDNGMFYSQKFMA